MNKKNKRAARLMILVFVAIFFLCGIMVFVWVNQKAMKRLDDEVAYFERNITFQTWDDLSVTRRDSADSESESRAVEAIYDIENRFPFLSGTSQDPDSKQIRALVNLLSKEDPKSRLPVPLDSERLKLLQDLVQRRQGEIQELREIADLPPSDAASIRDQLGHTSTFLLHAVYPSLVSLRTAASLLILDAYSTSVVAESSPNISSLIDAFRISQHVMDIPGIVALMTGITIQNDTLRAFKRIASEQLLDSEDLELYLDHSKSLLRPALARLALESKFLSMVQMFTWVDSQEDYSLRWKLARSPLFAFWSKQDEAQSYALMRAAIELVVAPCGEAFEQGKALREKIEYYESHNLRFLFTAQFFSTSYAENSKIICKNRTRLLLSLVAAELMLIRTRDGAYPETLDALKSDTRDPYSGKLFSYTKNDETFTLYSLGLNAQESPDCESCAGTGLAWRLPK